MPKFENYKLEMELSAQMPIIHFQYNQNGATVRATEMKPKLDKYLISLLGDVKTVKKDSRYKSWFLDASSDNNNGLNYKLQILASDKHEQVDLDSYPRMYFAKATKNTPAKYGVLADIRIIILCFNEELRKHIENNLVNFFLITNFGTSQNKGVGGYVPTEWLNGVDALTEEQKKDVANAFKTKNKNIRCYVTLQKGSHKQKADIIWDFVNEIKTKKNSYVRENYFKDILGINKTKNYKVNNASKSIKVERLKSPLYFKVIKDCIFVVITDYNKVLDLVNKPKPANMQVFLYDFITKNYNGKAKYKEVRVDA